jgi:CHRD domain
MRSKVIVPAMGAVALSLAGCGSSGTGKTNRSGVKGSSAYASASPPTRIYRISLNGKAEVPPGAPTGRSAAIIAFHGDSIVCWRFAHLHGFTSATFAHIHSGSQWQSGHIVVTLSTGPRLHHQGCVTVSPALTKAIWSAPSRYYVNIHSTRYPGGAVRGQL